MTNSVTLSFTARCLAAGSLSSRLNPSDKKDWMTYLAKPLRATARCTYALAVLTFAAPAGVIYHSGASIFYKIKSVRKEDGTEKKELHERHLKHFDAAMSDLNSFAKHFFNTTLLVISAGMTVFCASVASPVLFIFGGIA